MRRSQTDEMSSKVNKNQQNRPHRRPRWKAKQHSRADGEILGGHFSFLFDCFLSKHSTNDSPTWRIFPRNRPVGSYYRLLLTRLFILFLPSFLPFLDLLSFFILPDCVCVCVWLLFRMARDLCGVSRLNGADDTGRRKCRHSSLRVTISVPIGWSHLGRNAPHNRLSTRPKPDATTQQHPEIPSHNSASSIM